MEKHIKRILKEINFLENMPELHLVSAGSLLGVALKRENVSFPVGKVNRMQMYPMNFREFIQACGEKKYMDTLKTYKSAVTENYVLCELICQNKYPYFWRSGNTAEVDFLFEEDGEIYALIYQGNKFSNHVL